MKKKQPNTSRSNRSQGQTVVPATDRDNDMLRDEQKKRGQLPLHDEPIGGA